MKPIKLYSFTGFNLTQETPCDITTAHNHYSCYIQVPLNLVITHYNNLLILIQREFSNNPNAFGETLDDYFTDLIAQAYQLQTLLPNRPQELYNTFQLLGPTQSLTLTQFLKQYIKDADFINL